VELVLGSASICGVVTNILHKSIHLLNHFFLFTVILLRLYSRFSWFQVINHQAVSSEIANSLAFNWSQWFIVSCRVVCLSLFVYHCMLFVICVNSEIVVIIIISGSCSSLWSFVSR